jgi:hypothetical protein
VPAGRRKDNASKHKAMSYERMEKRAMPIHGNPGSNADFERIVGPVAARTPAQGGGG